MIYDLLDFWFDCMGAVLRKKYAGGGERYFVDSAAANCFV